jgi:hypothetical protein
MFTLIAGLALADVAGAVYLAVLWQERHPPGDQAQVNAGRHAGVASRLPKQRQISVERSQ